MASGDTGGRHSEVPLTELRWVIAGLLALFGAYMLVVQFTYIVRYMTGRESIRSSTLPGFGGLALSLGLAFAPVPGLLPWSWIPLVSEFGALLSLAFPAKRSRAPTRKDSDVR